MVAAWAQWLLRWRHNRRIFRILQFYSRERYMAPVFLKPGKTMSQKMTAWGEPGAWGLLERDEKLTVLLFLLCL